MVFFLKKHHVGQGQMTMFVAEKSLTALCFGEMLKSTWFSSGFGAAAQEMLLQKLETLPYPLHEAPPKKCLMEYHTGLNQGQSWFVRLSQSGVGTYMYVLRLESAKQLEHVFLILLNVGYPRLTMTCDSCVLESRKQLLVAMLGSSVCSTVLGCEVAILEIGSTMIFTSIRCDIILISMITLW